MSFLSDDECKSAAEIREKIRLMNERRAEYMASKITATADASLPTDVMRVRSGGRTGILCAFCAETITVNCESQVLMANHREVCPKRPLAVGDWVRWEHGSIRDDMPYAWIEGELKGTRRASRLAQEVADIMVSKSGVNSLNGMPFNCLGEMVCVGLGYSATITRIPRPAEVKQDVDVVNIVYRGSNALSWHCRAVGHDGKQCKATTTDWSMKSGVWLCPAHADPAAGISQPTGLGTFKIKYRGYSGPLVASVNVPAETKYDGLTGAECLERFHKAQREHFDRTYASLWLTPSQLAAARELWSLQLRAKVKESAERERNVVRVEIQDMEEMPW